MRYHPGAFRRSVFIGARDEAQLRDNLGAVGWSLSVNQIKRLDEVSAVMPPYPYYPYRIQEGFARPADLRTLADMGYVEVVKDELVITLAGMDEKEIGD
jgi:hypothetical protein